MGIVLLQDIAKIKMKLFVGSRLAKLESLWRDFISPERTFLIHVLLQSTQYLPSSASHFTDTSGCKVISSHHPENLPGFPGRTFDVPGRVLTQVVPVCVHFSRHGLSDRGPWCDVLTVVLRINPVTGLPSEPLGQPWTSGKRCSAVFAGHQPGRSWQRPHMSNTGPHDLSPDQRTDHWRPGSLLLLRSGCYRLNALAHRRYWQPLVSD